MIILGSPRREAGKLLLSLMPEKTRNTVLLILIVILIGLAVWTMLPSSGMKLNDLGYYSVCPFAPWSTLALLLAAGFIWAVRQYLQTRPR